MKRNLQGIEELARRGPLPLGSLRWMVFNASENGMKRCIARIGRRVYIDVDLFDDWLMEKNPDLLPAKRKAAAS